jgi:hypothetical protein
MMYLEQRLQAGEDAQLRRWGRRLAAGVGAAGEDDLDLDLEDTEAAGGGGELDDGPFSDRSSDEREGRAMGGGDALGGEVGPFDDPTEGAAGAVGVESTLDPATVIAERTEAEKLQAAMAAEVALRAGTGDGGGSGGGGAKQIAEAHHAHRHDLPERTHVGAHLVSSLIWGLVILHLLALAVWLRAWWRQKRSKDPTMRAHAGPPDKVTCSYDMDKSFGIPKIELPMKGKGLTLKQAKA